MISGFFYMQARASGKADGYVRRQLKATGKLFLLAMVLGTVFGCLVYMGNGISIWYCLVNYLHVREILVFLFFNEPPFLGFVMTTGPYWYLAAMIYVYLAVLLTERFPRLRVLCWGIPLLWIAGLLLGKYAGAVTEIKLSNTYTRNWLFTGIPYFAAGVVLQKFVSHKTLPVWLSGALAVLFAGTTMLERRFLATWAGAGAGDQFISTLFLSVSAFLLFYSLHGLAERSAVLRYLAKIGRTCSVDVYIFHMMIGALFTYAKCGAWYETVAPAAVFITAIVLFMLKNAVISRWKEQREKLLQREG